MNRTILPSALAKIVGQTELFNLGMTTGLSEGNLLNSTKNDLLSHPARAEGLGIYIYIYIYNFEECIFRLQVIIRASFVKDDRTLFIIFNFSFTRLLIFLVSGSRW